MKNNQRLKVATECGMLLATALALSNFKLFQMPSGGSVSLGPFPVLLIAARHGVKTGLISGGLLGILLLTTRPFIVHPLQFLLDYPLANAALGLAGMVRWESPLKAATATTIANIIRLHFHVIAGAVYFVSDKTSLGRMFVASYTYNIGHILPETIICAVLAGYLALNHKALCSRQ
ncbi:MAG: thiamine transporter [Clostridiales bacterium]|jgi:thiamine transporter|nr:thiamine transporter [Clostridiales bacterium]MDN5281491.1 thiamine transporter [Candidatus Ozemobacter sp.]